MSAIVLVEVVRGQAPVPYDAEELRRALGAGLVAPMVFASTDNGASWVRAHEAVGLPAPQDPAPAGDNAVMRMIVPVGRSVWAIVAGYWALACLFSALFWLAPILDSARSKPHPADLLTVAGVLFAATVLPTAGFAALGHRAIRRDPAKHGMGRVGFAYVAAGLHLSLMLVALVMLVAR